MVIPRPMSTIPIWPARLIVVAVAAALGPFPLAGGEITAPGSPAPELEQGTAARLLEAITPSYPQNPRMRGQEGRVQLSFSVKPDGTVADPIVEDSSGIAEFEKAAIRSVLKSRWTPTTWNGKPIEQCAAKMRYLFKIKGMDLGARREFVAKYRSAAELAQGQRIAEAEAKLEEMTAKGAWNNYESARLWLMRAVLQAKAGDDVGQLRSLRRAALANGDYLEKKLYPDVVRQIFTLEVKQRHYGAALETYQQFRRIEPAVTDAAMDKVVSQIGSIIDSPEVLAIPGTIEYRSGCEEGRPNWQHELLRRKFAFADVNGPVQDFQLRCDWKKVSDAVSTEKTWEVPRSWGWCQLFVFGDVGASLKVIEHPLDDTQKGFRARRIEIE